MNKNTSLLSIAMTILLSSAMGFAAENSNDRYNEIVAALSIETKKFGEDFISNADDIAVVENHKTMLQKELDSYKNSWTPTLLKVVGAGFALESARRGISLILSPITYEERNNIWEPISLYEQLSDIWEPISTQLGYLTYPISRSVAKVKKLTTVPLEDKVWELYQADKIGSTTHNVGNFLLSAIAPIATGLTAKYLFNKANSYKTEIARLEEEIAKDDAIITALQNQ